MVKNLYLMRHAVTVFNERKKIQGWCDSPLSSYGEAQAKRAADMLDERGISFDHAYCSTSGRTAQTLMLATRNTVSFDRLDDLREFSFGLLEGESVRLAPPTPFGAALVQYGGESVYQVTRRMVHAIRQIMNKPDHQNVLVVSHGASSLAFFDAFIGNSKVKLDASNVPGNASIIHYHYEDGQFGAQEIMLPDFSGLDELFLNEKTVHPSWLYEQI
ncbi:histidine phosphatase family protein [Atopobium fossor]|uniref:histidine phosphatase family protein n=1 Tax=Atopobium fossor TaxID=39487 RepID=UPI0004153EC1|nr:histidine phosphatase family protein [Atopobium fossor]